MTSIQEAIDPDRMRTGLIAILAAAGLALGHDVRADEVPKEPPKEQVDAGWSMGAGIFAVADQVLVTGAYAFGVTTANGENPIGIWSYIGSLALLLVTPPIIEGGARSARGVPGSPVARVIGWVTYGLAISTGLAIIISSSVGCGSAGICSDGWYKVLDIGMVAAIPGFGFASLTSFAVDAFVSAGQAHRALRAAPAQPKALRITLSPIVAPLASGGLVGGVGGTF